MTLTTPEGIELLMHIGLDTINLKGQGFTPRVKRATRSSAGDALIDFDADFIATHAKSLLTLIVVTNGERVAAYHPASGLVRAGTDILIPWTWRRRPGPRPRRPANRSFQRRS